MDHLLLRNRAYK